MLTEDKMKTRRNFQKAGRYVIYILRHDTEHVKNAYSSIGTVENSLFFLYLIQMVHGNLYLIF